MSAASVLSKHALRPLRVLKFIREYVSDLVAEYSNILNETCMHWDKQQKISLNIK